MVGFAAGGLLVGASCSSSDSKTATAASGPVLSAVATSTVVGTTLVNSSVSVPSSASVASGADTTDAASATTIDPTTTEVATTTTVAGRPMRDGATRMHFEIGPLDIKPGQNLIDTTPGTIPEPAGDGWVVRIAPNLHLEDGSIPGVDVIHLHHGVWLNGSARDATSNLPQRFFAAGEEKTTLAFPAGYGYQFHAGDKWFLNYMIHNLWPTDTKVWITYDIDFIPADSPAAVGIQAARPIWTDVENGGIYPVFDVLKGSGHDGKYTFPDDATDPYGTAPAKNQWTVDRDGILLQTAGHLHPGGLHTDIWLQRAGATAPADHAKVGAKDTAHLFESDAHYWEPAGAVSWDVAMTATQDTWRVAVKKGDVLSTSATYDSARASWYESMGIMVVWMADAPAASDTPAIDPFTAPVDAAGELTHGHLAENDNHGGQPNPDYVDPATLPLVAATTPIAISQFVYGQGDMVNSNSVPEVKAGGTITFDNLDAPLENGEWHTITACKAPCNQSTGIAYPLADGDISFDSGQLGNGGPPTAGRTTWTTPSDLPPGLYTYFCRIHPFMRGSFEIETATP